MKKIILSVVFVLVVVVQMNANTTVIPFGDCTQDAWDWGTEAGNGDPMQEYIYTNDYFDYYCNEDGTYKEGMSPVISKVN